MKHLVLFACALALLLAGCGDSGPKRYRVTGEVNFESKPVPDGSIVFTPVEPGVTDAAKIRDGKFDAQVTAGKKKIEITATREVGPVDPVMGKARRESYIPAKYNHETTLQEEIVPDGTNHFKYDLTP